MTFLPGFDSAAIAGGLSAHASTMGANAAHSAVPQLGAQTGTQSETPSFRSGLQAIMQSLPDSSAARKSLETQTPLESQEADRGDTLQNETQEALAPASGFISDAQGWKPFLQINTASQLQAAQQAQTSVSIVQKLLPAAKQFTASNSQAIVTQNETTVENTAASHAHSSTRSSTNSTEAKTTKHPAVTQQSASAAPTVIPLSMVPAIVPQAVPASKAKATIALNTESNSALTGTQSAIAGASQQPVAESAAQAIKPEVSAETATSSGQIPGDEFAADLTHATQQAQATLTQTAQAVQNGVEPATSVHASAQAAAESNGKKSESDPKSNADTISGAVNQATALKPTAAQESAAQPQAAAASELQVHPSLLHNPGTVPGASNAAANAGSTAAATTAPTAHETFTALDAGSAQPSTTLVHASARQVEAGYQDPTLGWVSVRADQTAAGVHASILPGTADATQALSTHMAALNSYLTQHHPGVSATVAAPQNSGVGGGLTGQGSGQQGTPGGSTQQQYSGGETTDAQSIHVPFAPHATSSVDSIPTARAHNGRVSVMA